MRELLRSSLGRALREHAPLDRIVAAWPVAAGKGLAAHGAVLSLEDGIVTIAVDDAAWHRQMIALRRDLAAALSRTANVSIRAIHFSGGEAPRGSRPQPGAAGAHSIRYTPKERRP